MNLRTVWPLLILIFVLAPAAAQTAAENYQKAMDAYQAEKYADCRSLLLAAEKQLGGPKLKTTSMLVLATYKSNSFDSADLLRRIAVYASLAKENDDLTAEIQGIESTVKSWKAQLDAKFDAIVKNRDLAGARTEAGTNYKMSDYNEKFRALNQELSAVKASLGGAKLSTSDRSVVLEAKKVAAGSRFGFEGDARQKLSELDGAFSRKVAELSYPDDWVAVYHELFGAGLNGAAVDKGRAARIAAAEQARRNKIARQEAERQRLLGYAADCDAKASQSSALGTIFLLSAVGSGALVIVGFGQILSNPSNVFSGVLVGLGAGGAYAFSMFAPAKFREAGDYRSSARDYRSRANRVSFSASPTFEYDPESGFQPGVAIAFAIKY